jgi:hypothetical protein
MSQHYDHGNFEWAEFWLGIAIMVVSIIGVLGLVLTISV